jgi:hypothetical protein
LHDQLDVLDVHVEQVAVRLELLQAPELVGLRGAEERKQKDELGLVVARELLQRLLFLVRQTRKERLHQSQAPVMFGPTP